MSEHSNAVSVALRIPGPWSHPKELVERLPNGWRLTPDTLFMPDRTEIEFGAAPADDQFAQIFRSSCRNQPTAEELATVDNYKVNVFLSGPGGSLAAARTMLKAGTAIIQAGGAGVFIDNSAVAHGGQQWMAMADDGGPEALSFAFVALIGSKLEVRTMGMHVLGLREVIMKLSDADEFDIIEVIRYLSESDKPMDDGHVITDLSGPKFQVFRDDSDEFQPGSPMYNPFGRLRLVSMKDAAERN
jgi:hypothetical protein